MGFHSFHIVSLSPWPFLCSLSLLGFLVNLFQYLNSLSSLVLVLTSTVCLFLVLLSWWKDVIRESTFQGEHTSLVQNGVYLGMLMFIMSEVMFFFSFFFGFFFSSLSPDIEIGGNWPPTGIQCLSVFSVPLLNTLILLSSGVSITWCHHSILESKKLGSVISGILTIFLGVVFLGFQFKEYYECSFTMCDGVFGSFFFVMTGFHGFHVLLGVLMIVVSVCRLYFSHFSQSHFLGFEMSAWYWHFVDVVWLFLYVSVYWWGS